MVPIIHGADALDVRQLAEVIRDLADRARSGALKPTQIEAATFSISSLGAIGGTAFTPIINAPNVAILGVTRTATIAHWDGGAFVPRQLLPLSLSYDHRAIDGVEAASFCRTLVRHLAAAPEN
jgi:pyruvate dehydrogenase E2 component (dihydrolipoamide acetyltransferase)